MEKTTSLEILVKEFSKSAKELENLKQALLVHAAAQEQLEPQLEKLQVEKHLTSLTQTLQEGLAESGQLQAQLTQARQEWQGLQQWGTDKSAEASVLQESLQDVGGKITQLWEQAQGWSEAARDLAQAAGKMEGMDQRLLKLNAPLQQLGQDWEQAAAAAGVLQTAMDEQVSFFQMARTHAQGMLGDIQEALVGTRQHVSDIQTAVRQTQEVESHLGAASKQAQTVLAQTEALGCNAAATGEALLELRQRMEVLEPGLQMLQTAEQEMQLLTQTVQALTSSMQGHQQAFGGALRQVKEFQQEMAVFFDANWATELQELREALAQTQAEQGLLQQETSRLTQAQVAVSERLQEDVALQKSYIEELREFRQEVLELRREQQRQQLQREDEAVGEEKRLALLVGQAVRAELEKEASGKKKGFLRSLAGF